MGRVHGYDVCGEVEDAGGMFVEGHDGAEVGGCFAVGFRVGDCCEGVEAIVEGDGEDVGPGGGVRV